MNSSTSIIAAVVIGLLAGALVVYLGPRLAARFKPKLAPLELLVVGPDDAGKTSFLNFLRDNQFADQAPTRDTLAIARQSAFKRPRAGATDLAVKRVWDIPGPLEPSEQLDLLRREAPKTLVVILSTDNPSSAAWLRSFMTGLRSLLSQDRRVAGRLISVHVVLNKMDLIGEHECGVRLADMVKIVDDALEPVIMSNTRLIDVLPTSLLSGKALTTPNRILNSIARAAEKNQRVVPR